MKRLLPILAVSLAGVLPHWAWAEARMAKPEWRVETWEVFQGDDDNVRLLELGARDEDPRLRERAVRDLGGTRNPSAAAHVRKALSDPDAGVRCAAITTGLELDRSAGLEMVRAGLGDSDSGVLLWTMGVARRNRLSEVAGPIAPLLKHKDEMVRSAALETLTHLETPAPAADIKRLMRDDAPAVRLRAAENSLLAPAEKASAFLDELRRLTGDEAAHVRSAAIAALGKFDFAAARQSTLAPALTNANPLLRRSAVRAYRRAAAAGRIEAPELAVVLDQRLREDSSPMVRLAAVEAAGKSRCADCARPVFGIMLAAKYDDWDDPDPKKGRGTSPEADLHNASRLSLRDIAGGGEAGRRAVAALAAGYLKHGADRLQRAPRGGTGPGQQLDRNMRACCWVLGEIGSDAAYETMLSLLSADGLRADSNVRVELARAVGKIGAAKGDARAAAVLEKMLKECIVSGRRYIAAAIAGQPGPPFSESVMSAAIEGLGSLRAREAVGSVSDAALVKVSRTVLPLVAATAVRTLPLLDSPRTRGTIERTLSRILPDIDHTRETRFHAAVAAGELRLRAEEVSDSLRAVIKNTEPRDRSAMLLIRAAAWAGQEITGGPAPETPEPRFRQGPWVIRKAKR